MGVVFWFLVVLGLILLWFVLSFAFRWIGKVFGKLYQDAVDAINEEDEKENESKE